ncbi:PH domain-containing protein [Sphingomonas koreensis]|nr:PH domain-containing protein [Sphingomonas koreensis]
MTEYENEPIPGLPGVPPTGERILWQGSPDWRVLARTAFHTRAVAGYFALLAALALISTLSHGVAGAASFTGTAMTIIVGIFGVALLHLLAWGSARSTIYTLTNRRVVLRIGMALPKCINLPIGFVGAVNLDLRADGSGDIPLAITGPQRLGYAGLWPHARPWRLAAAEPMLRAIPNASGVAALIARTCLAAHPEGTIAQIHHGPATAAPAFGVAVAA